MTPVFVGIGSNQRLIRRSPAKIVLEAAQLLAQFGRGLQISPLYRSNAWPDPSDPPYVNAVAFLETSLSPAAFLSVLHSLEACYFRVRYTDKERRYAPRTLDLDLLDHGGTVLDCDNLKLPHPGVAKRDFVLRPLQDIFPTWLHPVTGEDIQTLLKRSEDQSVRLPFTGIPS